MSAVIDAPSPNFDERVGAADMIVLHYTGMASGEAALRKLRDPAPKARAYRDDLPADYAHLADDADLGRASAHYMVGHDGRVFRLVAEDKRAWHAGAAFWAGETDVNSRAIGIEIVNGGHDFGLPAFPAIQIDVVIALVADIQSRWPIPSVRVVGHSDVAPERKRDPGERFPWERLAAAGVALDVPAIGEGRGRRLAAAGDAGPVVHAVQDHLIAAGYGLAASGAMDERTVSVLTAFQRRFRRECVDGVLDAESATLAETVAALSRSHEAD